MVTNSFYTFREFFTVTDIHNHCTGVHSTNEVHALDTDFSGKQEALQMQGECATHHKYEISHLIKFAIWQ